MWYKCFKTPLSPSYFILKTLYGIWKISVCCHSRGGFSSVTCFAIICELKPCKFHSLLKKIYEMSKKTCLRWSWNVGDVLGKTQKTLWSFIALPVDFHRCGLCSCTDPAAGWSPGAEQNLTAALWNWEWLCQAIRSSCTLLFSEEERIFPDFCKVTFASSTQYGFNCYPQNQSDKIRKPEREMWGG